MSNTNEILLLPERGRVLCIPWDAISHIEASSNYSKVYCSNRSLPIVTAKVLRWFETRLPQQYFARVHRANIVNKKHILAITKNTISLRSGTSITISRRKRKKVFMDLNIQR